VNGEVQQSNFHSYRVVRMSEMPQTAVEIISTPGAALGGVEEAGVPPTGGAIANAFAVLTGGKRLRHYPFLPECVKAALGA
jgi:isoquinoline 1-oxidoreductase beta subunit